MRRPDGPRDPVIGPDSGPEAPFPIRLEGEVIKGFGRGSKELGIPTANLPIQGLEVGGHSELESGVYFGFASLSAYTDDAGLDADAASHTLPSTSTTSTSSSSFSSSSASPPPASTNVPSQAQPAQPSAPIAKTAGVFPMVMSIGWNPYYKNSVRSVEVHVLHAFGADFYGAHMKVAILGFIRPEYDYAGLEALVEDIRTDIDVARRSLDRDGWRRYGGEAWLREF